MFGKACRFEAKNLEMFGADLEILGGGLEKFGGSAVGA
jgi:hypothetical protein